MRKAIIESYIISIYSSKKYIIIPKKERKVKFFLFIKKATFYGSALLPKFMVQGCTRTRRLGFGQKSTFEDAIFGQKTKLVLKMVIFDTSFIF